MSVPNYDKLLYNTVYHHYSNLPYQQPSADIMKILRRILERGANPMCCVPYRPSESVFQHVCQYDYLNAAELFIEFGADPTALNANNETALDVYNRGSMRYPPLEMSPEVRKERCATLLQRRAAYLEKKRKDDLWERRAHAVMALSGSGWLREPQGPLPTYHGSLPSILRKTKKENRDYLNESVFGNPVIAKNIVLKL